MLKYPSFIVGWRKNYSPQKYHHFLLPSHTLLCIHQSWERVHVRVSSHKTSAGFGAWSSLPHLILIADRRHGDQDVVAVGGREEVCWRDQTSWVVYSEPCVGDLSELVSQLDSSKAPFLPLGMGRANKTDEFSEKIQTAFDRDPPPSFSENYVANIFSENVQKTTYIEV